MSYPSEDRPASAAKAIPVQVNNWPEKKTGKVRVTTLKTYTLDPAKVIAPTMIPIAGYEPTRIRMVVQALDARVAITNEPPVSSPDNNANNLPTQGVILAANDAMAYVFLGPDAFWLNSLGTLTRVTVVKEYE